MHDRKAFTLIEALLAVAALAMLAAALATLYASGFRSIEVQMEEGALCTVLRSQMEAVMATPFDKLADGVASVTVMAQTEERIVTLSPVDLDADGEAESDAVRVTIELAGRRLSVLRIDHHDRMAKH